MKNLLFGVFALCSMLQSAEVTGKVIKIYDGDTIRIQDADGGKFKIRFADIDAPESTQPGGQEAKAFLCELVEGKTTKVTFREIDTYGRIVGTVYIDDIVVNQVMVGSGWAWWYRAYSKDQKFGALEDEARTEKRGIWKMGNPIPPWEFRKQKVLLAKPADKNGLEQTLTDKGRRDEQN